MDELVKIQMLTRGPNRNYRVREVVEVDLERARLLIEGGHAKNCGDRPGAQEVTDAAD